MGYRVDNAIIMAAGLSSRFAPISYEKPKALLEVKGEILIERQIRQLKEKGIKEIIVVVGYKKELFYYLKDKYNIGIIVNPDYEIRNNHSSIFAVRDYLHNSYICSADNFFLINPFAIEVEDSYYAAQFSKGWTEEWCIWTDKEDNITKVKIGGENQWYMSGHTFWSESFSGSFMTILNEIYKYEDTKNKLWEDIYCDNLSSLKMKIKRYEKGQIFEFDTLDELRLFDTKYIEDTGSLIMKELSEMLKCRQSDITKIIPLKMEYGWLKGMRFQFINSTYDYFFAQKKLKKLEVNDEK